MQSQSEMVRLIRRRRGGWLALSPENDSLKIGVTAETEEMAKARLEIATAEWRANLASGAPGAA